MAPVGSHRPSSLLGGMPFLISVVILAFALRVGSTGRSTWYDEACSYWEVAGASEIPAPRHYSTVHHFFIRPLVGRCDELWMLRLPFVVQGAASVLVFALAVREMVDRETAGLTAFLLALSPFHVYYSSEARMYAPLLLFAATSCLFFARSVRRGGWPNWVGYAIGTALALYSHAFAGLLILSQGLCLALGPQRRLLSRWLIVQTVVVLALMPHFLRAVDVYWVSDESNPWWISRQPHLALLGTFSTFMVGLSNMPAVWSVAPSVPAVILCGYLSSQGLRAQQPGRTWVFVSFLGPVLLAVAASSFFHIYSHKTTRYLAFAQPFLMLILASGVLAHRRAWVRLSLLVGLLAVLAVGLRPLYSGWDQVRRSDFPAVASFLRRSVKPGDCILATRMAGFPIAYYLRDGLLHQMLICPNNRLDTCVPPVDRVWLVGGNAPRKPERIGPRTADPRKNLLPVPPDYREVRRVRMPGQRPIVIRLMARGQ